MGAHVCMWLRCIERPIALVGIAPRLYAPQGARIVLYGHAPMELASLLTLSPRTRWIFLNFAAKPKYSASAAYPPLHTRSQDRAG